MPKRLKWYPDRIRRVVNAGHKGAIHGMTQVYNQSTSIVPKDDHELVLGARVSSDGESTDHITVIVSYGNNPVSAQYVVIQHENLSYNHKPGESAKYLELPFNQMRSEIPMTIADYIRNVL